MEDKQINLEKAKAWFVFAQISIILAGFFFATSGIAHTNSLNSLNSGINSLRLAEENCFNNNTKFLCNNSISIANTSFGLIKPEVNILLSSFWFGFVFVFISIIFCSVGYYKLRKIKIVEKFGNG